MSTVRFIRGGQMIEAKGQLEYFQAEPGDIIEIEPDFWIIVTHLIDHPDGAIEVCTVPYADNSPTRYEVPADTDVPAPIRWGLNALDAYAKWADGVR